VDVPHIQARHAEQDGRTKDKASNNEDEQSATGRRRWELLDRDTKHPGAKPPPSGVAEASVVPVPGAAVAAVVVTVWPFNTVIQPMPNRSTDRTSCNLLVCMITGVPFPLARLCVPTHHVGGKPLLLIV